MQDVDISGLKLTFTQRRRREDHINVRKTDFKKSEEWRSNRKTFFCIKLSYVILCKHVFICVLMHLCLCGICPEKTGHVIAAYWPRGKIIQLKCNKWIYISLREQRISLKGHI